MFTKKLLSAGFAAGLITTAALAGPVPDSAEEMSDQIGEPVVETYTDGMAFIPPDDVTLNTMNIRVYDMEGNMLLNVRSKGDIVDFPTDVLPDGQYKYDAVSVYDHFDPDTEHNEASTRQSGSIWINDGVLYEDVLDISSDNADEKVSSVLWRAANALVSSAAAQDEIANSDVPKLIFRDESDGDTASNDWEMLVNTDAASGNLFRLNSFFGNNSVPVMDLMGNGPLTQETIDVESNGDMELAGGAVNIDRSQNELGIGTSSPGFPLDIHDIVPEIEMFDESDNTTMHIEYNAPDLAIEGDGAQDIVNIHRDAPANTLDIDASGNVSMSDDLLLDGDLETDAVLRFERVSGTFGNSYITFTDSDNTWVLEQTEDSIGFQDGPNIISPTPFRIDTGAGSNALIVADTGVGIGTAEPDASLEIRRSDPSLEFTNLSTGQNTIGMEFSNNFLRIKGSEGQDIGKMNTGAPVGTFTTDAAGRTGYGTANPAASFNVKYRSAHGSVPVMLMQKPNNDEIFKVNFNGDTFVNGAIVHTSDANEKTNIQSVNYAEILEKVATLPIQQWQYKDAQGVDHIGPMAQDFHAAFKLGNTDKGIATVDASGVALAAIKALAIENAQLKAENARQQAELDELRSDRERLANLESVVAELAAENAEPVLTATN